MGGGREARIAFAAAPAFCNYETITGRGEIVQHFAGFPVVNHGSYRDRDIDGFAFAAPAIAAFAVTPALGFMFGIEAEVKKRVVVLAGDQSHVAAIPSIAAAGTAARNEFLAPERETAVTAVAGFDVNYNFVYKQRITGPWRLAPGPCLLSGFDADELASPAAIAEFDDARDHGEQRVVLTQTDVDAGLDAGAALANDNRPAGNHLAAEGLHAQALRVRIAAIFRTA
jgi:hypothetical protein